MFAKPFITRLTLENFRSIEKAVIEFDNPCLLVGRNATGKSNVLDALLFVAESMSTPINATAHYRLRRKRPPLDGSPNIPKLSIRLDFQFEEAGIENRGHYSFSVLSNSTIFTTPYIDKEQCITFQGTNMHWFNRVGDTLTSNIPGIAFQPMHTMLALPLASGVPEFHPLFTRLSTMRSYNFEAQPIRMTELGDISDTLHSDGGNLSGALYALQSSAPDRFVRIGELLSVAAPSIGKISINTERIDERPLLLFEGQNSEIDRRPFTMPYISDGSLRILALLTATLGLSTSSLISIEEPETGLHPGALGVVSDAIEAAAGETQIIVTTHSPDLLDLKWIEPRFIRMVDWRDGMTEINPLADNSVHLVQEHLAGAGELLRANALDSSESEANDNFPIYDKVAA